MDTKERKKEEEDLRRRKALEPFVFLPPFLDGAENPASKWDGLATPTTAKTHKFFSPDRKIYSDDEKTILPFQLPGESRSGGTRDHCWTSVSRGWHVIYFRGGSS